MWNLIQMLYIILYSSTGHPRLHCSPTYKVICIPTNLFETEWDEISEKAGLLVYKWGHSQ